MQNVKGVLIILTAGKMGLNANSSLRKPQTAAMRDPHKNSGIISEKDDPTRSIVD
jgi:hypothetical protein